MFDLDGVLVVVTGGGRGIGAEIASAFASCRAKVVVADRDEEAARDVSNRIGVNGGHAWGERLDVADRTDIAEFAARVYSRYGMVSVLINNAGVFEFGPIDGERSSENWDRLMGVNLTGAFELTKAFLEPLKACKGCVVNVSSVVAFTSSFGHVGYTTSKGGMRSLTQAMCRELAPFGIRVNAVAPGFIDTPMGPKSDPAMAQWIGWHCPLGRYGFPGEIAWPVVFLASSAASYVSGVTLPVDGGYLTV
ncbi:SDR family oxidoreductase [Bradyrhizobium sp. 141]|uniref:SDR family NAD(P)-dependent oxidoreductase n=1 Tax=Bradyrhizobium sp. 141 TaxID=2782617 RepID=UPI001FFB8046|nr:SDR family oxidoreductase [Bradyrhizobium sp. 141]MCK1721288.1 SDR family oxidoreductase [Bradyrhizobium sp. 141]